MTATDGQATDTEVVSVPATVDANDTPVLTVPAVAAPVEGTANTTTPLTTASAVDEDGNPVTYGIAPGSDPNGYYQINPTTGVVTLTQAGADLVNAGGDLPPLSVTATDGQATDTETVVVPATTDANDAPVLAVTPVASLTEGAAAAGTVVATSSASDEDGDTLTYSLSANPLDDNGDPIYAIDPNTGAVSLTAAGAAIVNAGGDLPAFSVTVSDSKGGSDTEAATPPATTDVNDAPVLTVTPVASLTEGAAALGTVVANASASDEDGDTLTYSLASNPGGYYAINSATGQVSLTEAGAAIVNAGGDLPAFSVTVSDSKGGSDTEVATPPATTDVNDAPVLAVTPVASLTEGAAAAGTVVATSSASDEDGDTLTYSLVAGSDPSGYFAIDPATGAVSLTAAGAAWVNAGNDLPAVQVSVSDGKGGSDTETAALPATTDVNDAPVLTVTPVASLTENTAAPGTVVANASASDEDGDTLTYSLASNPGGYYAINSVTGQVSLTAAGAALVNAGGDLPTFSVTVSDSKGGSDTEAATPPTTTDVNDAPVLTVTPIASLTEGTATVGMVIATSAATDEENDTLTFSLVAGSDPSGYYAIDPATGTVTLTAAGVALVNAGGDLPQVKVSVTDGTTPVTATANVPATIDVNDAPVLALTTPPQPMQGTAAAGDLVSHISSTDEDGGVPVYSIAANSDPLGFYQIQVVGGHSKVTLTAAGAAYVNGGGDLPPVSVTVSDGNGGMDTETVNVPTTFDTAPLAVGTPTPGDGVALSSIFQGATDVDTGSSLRGYAVTSAAANGTTNWQYSTNGGTTWTDFPAVTADSALLLAPSTLVRWEGTAGTNTALSVVAVDNTNTAGFETNVDTTPNGGSTAFSANVATLAANASVTPPVLLDLNHDGVIAYSQITADMNGDGVADLSSWVAAEDGLLFWDKHGDGSLTDRHQFAFAEFGGGTDLAGLALAFDSNHDNVLDAGDENFQSFRVWQDLDQDGGTDEGELMTLAAAGITAISLASDGVLRTPTAGVTEFGHGSAVLDDGSRMLVVDAQFEYHQYNGLSTSVL